MLTQATKQTQPSAQPEKLILTKNILHLFTVKKTIRKSYVNKATVNKRKIKRASATNRSWSSLVSGGQEVTMELQ